MRVVLAGYNVDSSVTDLGSDSATPETLSAAYARISRDPRPVGELREAARKRVERARRSNRQIVFEYGHGSVAEHAVFNLDVLDVSRLAAEALQSFRLASFTEKSQRYIRLDERDWIVPEELTGTQSRRLTGLLGDLFSAYSRMFDLLLSEGADESSAREDSRYVLPLATSCQMGVTMNAREIEHAVRRLASHPLREVRELASGMHEACSAVAPSLFLFTEPTPVDAFDTAPPPAWEIPGDLALIRSDDDSAVGSWLIRSQGDGSRCTGGWRDMPGPERKALFDRVLLNLRLHDSLPRCWELCRFVFEINLSATAYAQLKRHRMCTQLVSGYSPGPGVTVPPAVRRSRAALEIFEEAISRSGDLYAALAAETGSRLAEYALTNAHRRSVLLSVNARELYHFSRLREDEHAQWDIRELAHRMLGMAGEAAPLTMSLSGGKSSMELPG